MGGEVLLGVGRVLHGDMHNVLTLMDRFEPDIHNVQGALRQLDAIPAQALAANEFNVTIGKHDVRAPGAAQQRQVVGEGEIARVLLRACLTRPEILCIARDEVPQRLGVVTEIRHEGHE